MIDVLASVLIGSVLFVAEDAPSDPHPTTITIPPNAPLWLTMAGSLSGIVFTYMKLKHDQEKDHVTLLSEQQSQLDRQQNEWMQKLETQLEAKDNLILTLQDRIIQIEARYAVLEKEFESYKAAKEAAMDRLRAECDKYQSQLGDLQSLLKSERSENVRLTDRFNKLLIEKEGLEQRIKALQESQS